MLTEIGLFGEDGAQILSMIARRLKITILKQFYYLEYFFALK